MTRTNFTTKRLRALEPGDRLLEIEAARFVGSRGGCYIFDRVECRVTGGEFTHSTLSADGKTRTFHFSNESPIVVSSALSCKLTARVA